MGVREELFDRIAERARAEHRSVANMTEVLLEDALHEDATLHGDANFGYDVIGGQGLKEMLPTSAGRRATIRLKRTAMCEHRNPPGSYCPKCDA